MSIFGLGEIVFDKTQKDRSPLASLYNNAFENTTLRYPNDLGNTDKRHYMIFYVRKQRNTKYTGMTEANDNSIDTSSGSPINMQLPSLSSISSDVVGKLNGGLQSIDKMTGGLSSGVTSAVKSAVGSAIGTIDNMFASSFKSLTGVSEGTQMVIENSIKQITGGSFKSLKTTVLTTDAIALYMPDTLFFSQSQHYDEFSIGNEFAGQLAAAMRSATDAYKQGDVNGTGSQDASWAMTKAVLMNGADAGMQGALGGGGTGRLASAAFLGSVKNPMLEMIYSSPALRNFQFEFMFFPRSEAEALEVQKIIERFRFHQAPEFETDAQGFLIPPSEFDIRMYCNGQPNPNLPSIATCVLKGIDINYAPQGFTAYEVAGNDNVTVGGTGMPVAIQMTLQFMETTYLTKADYREDLAIGAR